MMVLLAVTYGDTLPWLVATGVSFAVFMLIFTALATATMPTLPSPGPEAMDLGPEPPAVANLLVNRCKVTSSAVAATLLDLAARKHVTIDAIGDGDNLVRLRGGRFGYDGTTPYEEHVLALVRDRADDNTVPANELRLGYGDEADDWWKRFEGSVIEQARELGLVRRRFSRFQTVVLAVGLAIPAAFAGVSFEVYSAAERAAGGTMDEGGGFAMAAVVWIVLGGFGWSRLRGWRETPKGDEVTASWLGVQHFLRRNDSLTEAPPAGVVIWERLLSYAVAVGVAHDADAALPIGPTRDDEGWSPYRGLWRHVRIRYPRRLYYGESPGKAALLALLRLVGFLAVVALCVALVIAADDITDSAFGDDRDAARRAELIWTAAACIAAVIPAVQAARATRALRGAIGDLRATETIEGYVVRVPWHYVSDGDSGAWVPKGYTAVDDGRDDEVEAVRYYRTDINEGDVVRVTMTPRLRHVVSMEVVEER